MKVKNSSFYFLEVDLKNEGIKTIPYVSVFNGNLFKLKFYHSLSHLIFKFCTTPCMKLFFHKITGVLFVAGSLCTSLDHAALGLVCASVMWRQWGGGRLETLAAELPTAGAGGGCGHKAGHVLHESASTQSTAASLYAHYTVSEALAHYK